MPNIEDIRAIARQLPRTDQVYVRDRFKLRVKSIVYLAVSRDESTIGFAFFKEERRALVASDPNKFMMPDPADERYNWVQARLNALEVDELQELVIDAWRMVVPKFLAKEFDEAHSRNS